MEADIHENRMETSNWVEAVLGLISMVVISYLIGSDANRRGRSGVLWGLLCFFTCIIAVPIYFLLTSEDDTG